MGLTINDDDNSVQDDLLETNINVDSSEVEQINSLLRLESSVKKQNQ